MRVEELIETRESRRLKKRTSFTRIQYLSFGISIGVLAGYADAWWGSWQTSLAFFLLGIVVGIFKARTCSIRWSRAASLTTPIEERKSKFVDQEEW